MISIIISSQNVQLLQALTVNIKAVIGVPFEIIAIENNNAKYSICQAYNIGAAKSKFNILCFMHEDIVIQTANWGAILIQHFNNTSYGVIGVAGSIYKSNIPCSWDGAGKLANRINILQLNAANKSYKDYYNPANEIICQVVTLDGVFISCKKVIFEALYFNENLLKGFHGYDIDFTLRANKITNLGVIFNIDILHYSNGSFKEPWLAAQIALHNKIFTHNAPSIYVANNKLITTHKNTFDKNSYKGTLRTICNQPNFSMQIIKKWVAITNPKYLKYTFFTLKYLLKAKRLRRK